MATLKSIAAEAGVSPMVVSAVVRSDFSRIRVSEPVREKIRGLIKKHGYVPNAMARSLSRNATNLVTIFVPSMRFFEIPFQNQLLTSMQRRLQDAGYRLSFCSFNSPNGMQDVLADVGLFFFYGEPNYKPLEQVRKLPFPLVVFGDCEKSQAVTVYRDNRSAMRNFVEELIAKGHRNITHIQSYTGNIFNHKGTQGIDDAVANHDVVLKRTKVYEHRELISVDEYWLGMGSKAVDVILDEHQDSTLILFESDLLAMVAIQELEHRGVRVPEDVSVAANGCNFHTGLVAPRVAKLTADAYEAGETCAKTLLSVLKDKSFDPNTRVEIPMFITWGDSVKDIS